MATEAVELIAEDGIPMETGWHRYCMYILIDSISYRLQGRDDYVVGGNQFIYFSEEQARNRNYRGPDFFLVLGVPKEPLRPYWCVWREGGRYPDVIIELLSPATADMDRTVKKDIYCQVFRLPNYFCFDPDEQRLEGWDRPCFGYIPLQPNDRGWLWCDKLQLWLGTWRGKYLEYERTWLRWYDANGVVLPTFAEAAHQELVAAQQQLATAQQQTEKFLREKAQAEAEFAQLTAQLAERQAQRKPQ